MHRTEDWNEEEIFRLLESVDSPPPALTAGRIAATARRRRRRAGWYRWAAIILLVAVVGGVAYAMPGSPFRSWLESLTASPRTPASERVSPPASVPAGIAMEPGERLTIAFDHSTAGSRARIVLTDASQLMVETPAGAARFTAGSDRLVVTINRDSTLVQVSIPRSAPHVEILAGTRLLLRKTGPGIVTPFPIEADSSYFLRLTP